MIRARYILKYLWIPRRTITAFALHLSLRAAGLSLWQRPLLWPGLRVRASPPVGSGASGGVGCHFCD